MTEGPDDELVRAAVSGSSEAFARIVRHRRVEVLAFLRRFGLDRAEAEDVAQETFVTAWMRIAGFRGDSTLRAWLCGIAYRKALTRNRGARRRRQRDLDAAELAAASEDPRGDTGVRADVHAALRQLPTEQRAVVALCLGSDFSDAEAARALDKPLGTVKSHLRRGRAALAARLGDYHEP